jgi:hypothetical protein
MSGTALCDCCLRPYENAWVPAVCPDCERKLRGYDALQARYDRLLAAATHLAQCIEGGSWWRYKEAAAAIREAEEGKT